MVRFIAWIAVCVLLGAIVGYLAAPLGDAGWLLIAALIAAILVAPRLYVMYRLPAVLDKRIRRWSTRRSRLRRAPSRPSRICSIAFTGREKRMTGAPSRRCSPTTSSWSTRRAAVMGSGGTWRWRRR